MTALDTPASPTRRRVRRVSMFFVALALVAVLWEFYKWVGPESGGDVFGWRILPKTNDRVMPHAWEPVVRLFEPAQTNSTESLAVVVLRGAWYSFRLALVGLVLGTVVGLGLAVLMARFRIAERGLVPYLVASQTVPLIALAPLVVSWGGKVQIGDWVWPRWLSASVLGAFLAFFPIAIGTLKGLKSAPLASLELMDSYAASWNQTLWKLRFPAAVPYIVPSLRLAASASVIGVVVAEISTGLKGGIGRLIIEFARVATNDPSKVYTAVFGAALLGLVMASLVALIDFVMMRNRPKEAAA
jgi:NitT/TauT family transport system permease protein